MSFFMEIFSTIERPNDRISSRGMAAIGLTAIMVATSFSTGCQKPKPPAVQTAVDQNTNPAIMNPTPVIQQPSPANPATVTAKPAAGPDLRELDRGLIRWIVSNRHRPANFEEFAATANITIPPPPAGKKYVFDQTMHIQLVDH
jgi:hypothetical protein